MSAWICAVKRVRSRFGRSLQRLLLVAQSCRERPNRDLTRFTAQIQALIDRWEK